MVFGISNGGGSVYRTAETDAPVIVKQLRVFHALILHDIKTRFFGNGLGYIVTILWPSAHILIVVSIYAFKGPAPYGSSMLQYASLSVLPYIMWSYISRFTMLGMTMNRCFLQYPVVKPLDIILARQSLEIITCTIIIIGLYLVLTALGIDAQPKHSQEAAFAILSAALLGVGFGTVGAVLVMIFPLFNVIYVGILLIGWVSAGVALRPEAMPREIGEIFAWNPLLHSIQWLRIAYYDDFPDHLLDKSYVLNVGAGALTLGLVLERSLRFLTVR